MSPPTLEGTVCPASPLWAPDVWGLHRSTHTEKYRAWRSWWHPPDCPPDPSRVHTPPCWKALPSGRRTAVREEDPQGSPGVFGSNQLATKCWRTRPPSSIRLWSGGEREETICPWAPSFFCWSREGVTKKGESRFFQMRIRSVPQSNMSWLKNTTCHSYICLWWHIKQAIDKALLIKLCLQQTKAGARLLVLYAKLSASCLHLYAHLNRTAWIPSLPSLQGEIDHFKLHL